MKRKHTNGGHNTRYAIIPAAGIGSRLLPATKVIPKEMLTLVDRPAIEYVIDEALRAGIEHIVIVTARNKSAIEDHFDRHISLESELYKSDKNEILEKLINKLPSPGTISFVRQHQPLGLGHAIWCARHIVGNSPFAVMLPDMIYVPEAKILEELIECEKSYGGNVLAVEHVTDKKVSKYGIIDFVGDKSSKSVEITNLVEKPSIDDAPSNWGITGRYVLQPDIFQLIENTPPDARGEIQLTDAIKSSINKMPNHAIFSDITAFDCGNPVNYVTTNLALSLKEKQISDEVYEMASKLLADYKKNNEK